MVATRSEHRSRSSGHSRSRNNATVISNGRSAAVSVLTSTLPYRSSDVVAAHLASTAAAVSLSNNASVVVVDCRPPAVSVATHDQRWCPLRSDLPPRFRAAAAAATVVCLSSRSSSSSSSSCRRSNSDKGIRGCTCCTVEDVGGQQGYQMRTDIDRGHSVSLREESDQTAGGRQERSVAITGHPTGSSCCCYCCSRVMTDEASRTTTRPQSVSIDGSNCHRNRSTLTTKTTTTTTSTSSSLSCAAATGRQLTHARRLHQRRNDDATPAAQTRGSISSGSSSNSTASRVGDGDMVADVGTRQLSVIDSHYRFRRAPVVISTVHSAASTDTDASRRMSISGAADRHRSRKSSSRWSSTGLMTSSQDARYKFDRPQNLSLPQQQRQQQQQNDSFSSPFSTVTSASSVDMFASSLNFENERCSDKENCRTITEHVILARSPALAIGRLSTSGFDVDLDLTRPMMRSSTARSSLQYRNYDDCNWQPPPMKLFPIDVSDILECDHSTFTSADNRVNHTTRTNLPTRMRRHRTSDTDESDCEYKGKSFKMKRADGFARLPLPDGHDVTGSQGQIKLSVYVNSGHLTVQVVGAKWLPLDDSLPHDTAALVSLIPEVTGCNKICRTSVVRDSSQPTYDEKFSFELTGGDLQRRLLITVWQIADDPSNDRFVGATSFGIRNIASSKTIVEGWYWLLDEKVAKSRHQMATSRSSFVTTLQRMRTHKMVLERGKGCRGFGMTLAAGTPCTISRITFGGPAYQAGLQPGDVIERVNGYNVLGACTDAVARIIRHCPRAVIMKIKRYSAPSGENIGPTGDQLQRTIAQAYAKTGDVITHTNSDDDDDLENDVNDNSSLFDDSSPAASSLYGQPPLPCPSVKDVARPQPSLAWHYR